MDSNSNTEQNWNILNWNVQGLNSDDKRNAIRAKLEESACSIFCLQETKSQHFDHLFYQKDGAQKIRGKCSGGIFMGWCGAIFSSETIFKSRFAITVKFTAMLNAETWTLTTVNGPCTGLERQDFIN
jgi:exonuclease III